EAAERRERYGPNEIDGQARRNLIVQLARRLVDPLVAILLVAAAVSVFAGEAKGAALIFAIVVASIVIETVQTARAQRTADLLRARASPTATVRREGVTRQIAPSELVPGDLVELDAGDLVPADARLLAAKDLHVHQAALTGEPMPVERTAISSELTEA